MNNPFSFTRRQFLKRLAMIFGGTSIPLFLPTILRADSPALEILSVVFSPTTVRVGDLLTVTFSIRNNSGETLKTQDPAPGFVYEQGESFRSYHFNERTDCVRVAVDYQDWDGVSYPYRWGLGSPLAPGETRTIQGLIHLRGPHRWKYWAGAVREWIQWYQGFLSQTVIESTYAITNPPTSTPSPSPTAVPSGTPKILGVVFSPTTLKVGELLSVRFTVRNDSNQTLLTQDPSPDFVYDESDSFRNRFPAIDGAHRVGVDSDRNGGFPYRWGLGAPLAPGQTTTITGAIRLKQPQTTKFWGGLTREGAGWLQDREGLQTIQVNSSDAISKRARVVYVHSENATFWRGQSNYWDYIDQNTVNYMVERGMMALTGASSLVSAWRTILPYYRAGQGIAVKLNFNNSGDGNIDANVQIVNAVLRGMVESGVRESDIWLFDAIRIFPERFMNRLYYRASVFDDGTHANAGFDSVDSTAVVSFAPPAGVPMPSRIKVTDVLVRAVYVINLPLLKAHLGSAGVTLGFKNHFGSINRPMDLHDYIFPGAKYFRRDYNPLVDLYRNPNIGKKTVLTIGDGLFSGDTWGSPAKRWRTFENRTPNSLFFSTDPVAIDSVMCDYLAAEWQIPADADNYLRLAAEQGLGVYERGDPVFNSYRNIEYVKVQM